MDNSGIIRDYVILRSGKVVRGGREIFSGADIPVGEFLTAVYKQFSINYPKFYKMDNLCKLGFMAAELLLRDKKTEESFSPDAIGIVLSNRASSLDTDRNHQRSILNRSEYFPSPSVFVYTLANIVIGEICIRFKFFGENAFFIEEKFDADRLYAYVKQLLDDNIVQCCVTGWVEVDGDTYDGVLYLVEKTSPDTDGFAIFDPGNLTEIFSRRS
jgi:hypothetical protein